MRKLVLASAVLGMGIMASPAALAGESGGSAVLATMMANRAGSVAAMPGRMHGRGAMWGSRVNGRWSAGWQAPGGWVAYRRPAYGFVLPRYWINPSYYIADYRAYGLPQPAYGYGWSRYYDDAVLTDRYGRVVDSRYGYDWDRYGGYDDGDGYAYDDGYRPDDRYYDNGYDRSSQRRRGGNAVAGAVAGGVIGGIAGSAIAGRGDRATGAILGAGVGAIAGAAIGDAAGRDRGRLAPPPRMDHGYAPMPYGDDDVTIGGQAVYEGRWVGTWYGRDGSTYSGTYDGRFDGSAGHWHGYSEGGYVPAPALPYVLVPAYGYSVGGQYYEARAVAVDYVAPTVTTYVTETTTYARRVAKPAMRKARVWRAKARPACSCSCVCR